MNTISPRTWAWIGIVSLVAGLFVTVTGWLLAAPADDIVRAAAAGGSKTVSQMAPDAFLDAFAAALVDADQAQTPAYVAAAIKMRPDLQDRIKTTAAEVDDSSTAVDGDSADRCISRHRHRVKICCHGHTLVLPPEKARRILQEHPECMRGACRPLGS